MSQKSHGKMHRARKIVKKGKKKSITRYVNSFKEGDKVGIDFDATSKFPHPSFHGKTGVILKKQGRAYKIKVKSMHSEKIITIKPEHIRKIK